MQNLLTIRVQILELFLNFHLESKRFVSLQVVDGGHEAFIINLCERALLLNTEFSDKDQSWQLKQVDVGASDGMASKDTLIESAALLEFTLPAYLH